MAAITIRNTAAWVLAVALGGMLAGAPVGAHAEAGMQVQSMQRLGDGAGWASDGRRLLFTSDAGTSWGDVTPAGAPNGLAAATFLDEQAGWVLAASAAAGLQVLATRDRGTHWQALGALDGEVVPSGSRVSSFGFSDAMSGWLLVRLPSSANFSFGRLFVTRDGGASWQRLPDPPAAGTLHFDGGMSATLETDPERSPSRYTSRDGGRSWQVAGRSTSSDLLAAARNRLAGNLAAEEDVVDAALGADGSGWVLVAGGTCREHKTQCFQHRRLLAIDPFGEARDITPPAGPGPAAVVPSINKKGFDKCAAATASQTNAWWPNTPWSWLNIYIGGGNRACSQSNLTPAWINAIFPAGWTLVPTWVGPQAPVGSYCGSCSKISTDLATAHQQGRNEAEAATNAASALGLTPPTIIYYDMEGYSPRNQPAVNAFISGWTERLHQLGNQSGVYSGPYNLATYAGIADEPDAIWIAAWNGNTSVYGITGLPDSLWNEHRRLHQYEGGHDETWNGVTFNIDSNSSDGPVAGQGGCTVLEPILAKYNAMGGAGGILGPCLTNTNPTADGGKYNHFQNGSIYFSDATGVHEVHGAIAVLWYALTWELGPLGYPVTDELPTADGIGAWNEFQRGAIYWRPDLGAHEVYGAIFNAWNSQGRELGCFGYPISGEYADGDLRRSDFEFGTITWSQDQGIVAICDRIFADGFE